MVGLLPALGVSPWGFVLLRADFRASGFRSFELTKVDEVIIFVPLVPFVFIWLIVNNLGAT